MPRQYMIQEIQQHIWRVTITEPLNEKNRYNRNRWPLVMSDTAEEAISIVKEKWPGCVVWAIQHVTGPKKNDHENNPLLVRS